MSKQDPTAYLPQTVLDIRAFLSDAQDLRRKGEQGEAWSLVREALRCAEEGVAMIDEAKEYEP